MCTINKILTVSTGSRSTVSLQHERTDNAQAVPWPPSRYYHDLPRFNCIVRIIGWSGHPSIISMGGCSSQEAAVEAPPAVSSSSVPQKVRPLKSSLKPPPEEPSSQSKPPTSKEEKEDESTEDFSDLGYKPDMTKNSALVSKKITSSFRRYLWQVSFKRSHRSNDFSVTFFRPFCTAST